VSNARLDAEVLLRAILKKDRAWLLAHIHDALDEEGQKRFERTVGRRARREPLQYITGCQEFWGLEFIVSPDVLIPRPETELIIESVLSRLPDKNGSIRLLDLCTGSGCIAVSLAKELPAAQLFAIDKSPAALAIARNNAQQHGVSNRIRFFEGDLFGPIEELDIHGQVDMIVTNPPYVSLAEQQSLQPEVGKYEPAMALFAGPEGTELQKLIIDGAPGYLKSNGMLVMEMGIGQAERLMNIISMDERYRSSAVIKDLAGIDRVIIACKK